MDSAALVGLVVALGLGVPQLYFAYRQVRLAEEQRRRQDAMEGEKEAREEAAAPPPADSRKPPAAAAEPLLAATPEREPDTPAASAPLFSDNAARVGEDTASEAAPLWALGVQAFLGAIVVYNVVDLEGFMNTWPTTPRAEWASALWTYAAMQLIVSVVAGASAFKWFVTRKRAFWDRGRELLYLAIAALGLPLIAALVIVRHDVMW
ncbi:hypothetical protein FAF44_19885 [Nonomuraea sp. MG754425]|uniref:hypothetical protein n=1 Tax=Nonomuraea sp. MG754425 TaxID=2570319 RepID=UPI001F4657D7|nr:hypothetical protein [Nonomuraea sp. MG754425]MCF6470641.1 hypothetical protein [Nonomuraea sp. MG754425]